ncbi:MAG: hypothetical protein IKI22_05605 [Neisseriaceae bacterium]|nr:hypothetical protein [Neisseriaceae bacterium]
MQNWQMRDEFKVVVVKNKIYNNKLGETSSNAQRSPPTDASFSNVYEKYSAVTVG